MQSANGPKLLSALSKPQGTRHRGLYMSEQQFTILKDKFGTHKHDQLFRLIASMFVIAKAITVCSSSSLAFFRVVYCYQHTTKTLLKHTPNKCLTLVVPCARHILLRTPPGLGYVDEEYILIKCLATHTT